MGGGGGEGEVERERDGRPDLLNTHSLSLPPLSPPLLHVIYMCWAEYDEWVDGWIQSIGTSFATGRICSSKPLLCPG